MKQRSYEGILEKKGQVAKEYKRNIQAMTLVALTKERPQGAHCKGTNSPCKHSAFPSRQTLFSGVETWEAH